MFNLKKRIFEIMNRANDNDNISRYFDFFIIVLILLNVFLVILDTFALPQSIRKSIEIIEITSIIIFTLEYILRIWTASLLYPELSDFKATIKYIFSFMALIDLLSILPFYIPFLIPVDLRVLRVLRIVRILRLFKMSRYTNALETIGNVFKNKSSQLLSSLFVVALLMTISSILMYNIENQAQPEAFNNAFSGLWWAVATFTTVGYGDIYPITALGKILSAIIAILGIGLVAVPTGIISAGFMESIENKDKIKKYCPYCGEKID